MNQTDQPAPRTTPSLHYFRPYRQTIIGFVLVGALVALLIVSIQWLIGV